jgi:purine-nucleoside phosphorylase
LILTNAAGGVNLNYRPGDFMLISDHINLTFQNPLIGAVAMAFSSRFPDMSHTYDEGLRGLAHKAANRHDILLQEGVYAWFAGPSFETPAEIRMARILGADAVGMSTVPEALSAKQCGMRILGVSLIANMAAGVLPQPITGEEVIALSQQKGPQFAALIKGTIQLMDC